MLWYIGINKKRWTRYSVLQSRSPIIMWGLALTASFHYEGTIWSLKASIVVPPNQESEWLCTCMLEVSISRRFLQFSDSVFFASICIDCSSFSNFDILFWDCFFRVVLFCCCFLHSIFLNSQGSKYTHDLPFNKSNKKWQAIYFAN